MVGRTFPVSPLDFDGLTQSLSAIRTQAQASGTYFGTSTVFGYDLVFATSGLYSVYKVTALADPPNGCTNTSNQPGWGTWSVGVETLFATGTIPTHGVMFFEDHLWVRGAVNGKRVTVGSGRFPDNPSTRTSITVNEDLRYTNYDGTDSIGLVAQNNFNVGLMSDDYLRIDGALAAQNGRVGRFYYQAPSEQSQAEKCAPWAVRQEIALYGMILSNQRYGFGYSDLTGYIVRNLIYDTNFLYGPPPNFPLLGTNFQIVSWEEVQ